MITFNDYINEAIMHDLNQECKIREQRVRINRLKKENWELRHEVHTLRELMEATCPKTLEEFDRITVSSKPVNRIEERNF